MKSLLDHVCDKLNRELNHPEKLMINMIELSMDWNPKATEPEEKRLPMKWDDLEGVDGYYVHSNAYPMITATNKGSDFNKNTWPTLAEAEASIALAQLLQLRNAWGGFHAETQPNSLGYCVTIVNSEVCYPSNVFRFKDEATRDLFQSTFADLIKQAAPLL